MLNINSFQIDSHCWGFHVTDGYQTIWNAQLNSNRLVIRFSDKDYGKVIGEATVLSHSEGEAFGAAMQLIFNWVQIGPVCNEKLDRRWIVNDEYDRRYGLQFSENPVFSSIDYSEKTKKVDHLLYPSGCKLTIVGTLRDLALTEDGYFVFEVGSDTDKFIYATLGIDHNSFSEDLFAYIDKSLTFEITVNADRTLKVMAVVIT